MISLSIKGRPGYLAPTRQRPTWQRALSLNSRVHWRQQAAVKKRDKEDVYIAALACRDQIPATPWDRANVTIDLYVKSNVTRDADNLYATVKGSLDGLKRAGIIKDDSTAVIGTPTIRVFKDTERAYEYVITLEERP